MKRITIPLLALLAALNVVADSPRPSKPNIVLILIDDLGWQDVKCYDIDEPSPMETPNIDALAKRGVMFWQAYSPAPVCAPSRAAILSGLHPTRGEMTHVAGGNPPQAGHPNTATISPWYSARMPVDTYTLAEAMKAEGYATGHSGKWHISQAHYDYPNPYHHGFDISTHNRGVQYPMKPDRLTGFATKDPKDPHRLDKNGFPFDIPQQAAMDFLKENRERPFFLYYATWLVHAPIVMRSEALLRKYETKLGVKLTDEHKKGWSTPGQTNPFYCAMVEQLDYYLGQIFDYLQTTDDPRWPGHKLVENTYIIFTSDNGGMEGGGKEIYTDNYPLDRGKISLREGGTRVPLIITGPDVPAGVQTDVMANGLDFYPTILSWIGAKTPRDKTLDGCDLVPLLTNDPTAPSLVRDRKGQVRKSMSWHFPQAENTSSIREGDYKLLRAYRGVGTELYLHRLYNSEGGKAVRGDIEEMKNLAKEMPEKAAALDAKLTAVIEEMDGRLPYGNPNTVHDVPHKKKVPTILGHTQDGKHVAVTYRNNGAAIKHADLIYSPNNGREWLRASGQLGANNTVDYSLPNGTTHYFINLVDENNFLVIHPPIDSPKMKRQNKTMADVAIAAGYPPPSPGAALDLGTRCDLLRAPRDGRTLLASVDFEAGGIDALNTAGEEISITEDSAAAGKRSLRMRKAKDQERPWMPLVSKSAPIPADTKSGIYRASFDVMLDKNAPGALNITLKQDRQSFGSIDIKSGAITANGRNIMGLTPGSWVHLDITCRFGSANTRMLALSVITAAGQTWTQDIPYSDIHFDRPDSLQIIGSGPVNSIVYLDNLAIAVERVP